MHDNRCSNCGGVGCPVCMPHLGYAHLTSSLSDLGVESPLVLGNSYNQAVSGSPYHLTYPYSYFVAPPGASYEEAIALCKAEMENRKK